MKPIVPRKQPSSATGRFFKKIQGFFFGDEYPLDKNTKKVVDMVLSSWNGHKVLLERTGVDLENLGVYEEALKHHLGAYLKVGRPVLGTLTDSSPCTVHKFVTSKICLYLVVDHNEHKEFLPETQDSESIERFIAKYRELKAMANGID